jgi:DNA-binding transcriptional MerR regulator/methylmalonyl-CoA mutase cobalamin-binding subunit
MDSNPIKASTHSKSFYPISTVAKLTGVNPITLRAWERRYQLVEPIRKASGHRLYTQQHIDRITNVLALLDRGIRISQVKAKLESEESIKNSDIADYQDCWKQYLDSMIAAVIRFDEAALEDAYGIALSLHPTSTVTDKVLIPLLKELGRRWAAQEGSIAEEHFFGFYLRNKLGARFHHRSKLDGGSKLLMACLPGERHETGLLLVALAASEAGYQTILLGSDMPLEELPAAALKTNCDAIILSAMLDPVADVLEQGLRRLTNNTEVPIFLGGKVSISANEQLRKIGVHALGTDLSSGLKRVIELVPPRR